MGLPAGQRGIDLRALVGNISRQRDDLRGLAALSMVLDELEAIHAGHAETLTPAEYVGGLRAALAAVEITPGLTRSRAGGRDGAVSILDAYEARTVSFPTVFVAGLREGTFPRAHRENPFYGEEERERLRRQGLWLARRAEDQREEMFLFLMAVTRATERLYLACPYVDAAGREQVVSSYLEEVRRVLGEAAGRPERTGPADVAPDWSMLAGDTDLRLRVVNDLWGRGLELAASEGSETARTRALAGLNLLHRRQPVALRTLLRGAAMERERESLRPPGRFDGVLADTRVLERLGVAFHADRAMSPTSADQYLGCPFVFFLERVLRVMELPEPQEDFPVQERGLLLHQVVADFYRRRGLCPPSAEERDEAMRLIISLAEERFRRAERLGLAPAAGLWRVHREDILHILRRFIDLEIEAARNWRPKAIELTFGAPDAPCQISHETRTMRIHGRVDRVDVPADGAPGLRVIDYKSGANPPDPKRSLQLPLYLWASTGGRGDMGSDGNLAAAYYCLKGQVGPVEKDLDWHERMEEAAAAALGALDGIRAGRFPPNSATDIACPRYCPWTQVCRREGDRLARKPAPEDDQP